MKESAIKPSVFPSPKIMAGFSTRHGGKGSDHLATLNLSYSVAVDRDIVDANRSHFFGQFGFSNEDLATIGQVHGTDVCRVDGPGFYAEHDGLVTSTRGVALCITAADCAAVLLGDAKNEVVGACHAGWRGAAGGIVTKTIDLMVSEGADRNNVFGFVSPCISVDRFEVGDEVAIHFDEKHIDRSKSKPHVDLKSHILDELFAAGVQRERIEVSSTCTYMESDTFFSHRAHNGKTGRMMGFIALTK